MAPLAALDSRAYLNEHIPHPLNSSKHRNLPLILLYRRLFPLSIHLYPELIARQAI